MTTYILNAAVITNYGIFTYEELQLGEVRQKLKNNAIICAIGHESTAKLFSIITGYEVTPNRIQVKMVNGDHAIVFWMNKRLPEGYIVTTIEELSEIGFSFGWLSMVKAASK